MDVLGIRVGIRLDPEHHRYRKRQIFYTGNNEFRSKGIKLVRTREANDDDMSRNQITQRTTMPSSTSKSTSAKAQPWKAAINATETSGNEYIKLSGPVADREDSGTLSGQRIDLSQVFAQREESGTLSG
ncbi:hypothetical protein NHQ30_007987 [Ciborinia camelliae]|nr:hypothetical protein NHQ30_007987 [Ciborinia camelliae]